MKLVTPLTKVAALVTGIGWICCTMTSCGKKSADGAAAAAEDSRLKAARERFDASAAKAHERVAKLNDDSRKLYQELIADTEAKIKGAAPAVQAASRALLKQLQESLKETETAVADFDAKMEAKRADLEAKNWEGYPTPESTPEAKAARKDFDERRVALFKNKLNGFMDRQAAYRKYAQGLEKKFPEPLTGGAKEEARKAGGELLSAVFKDAGNSQQDMRAFMDETTRLADAWEAKNWAGYELGKTPVEGENAAPKATTP